MRKQLFLSLFGSLIFMLFSCEFSDQEVIPESQVPQEILSKLTAAGFQSHTAIPFEEGFLVEGDIYLTADALEKEVLNVEKLLPTQEHYRTYNIVKLQGTQRTIKIFLSNLTLRPFHQDIHEALDQAILFYNNQHLTISFKRVSRKSDADIVIKRMSLLQEAKPRQALATAGFPDSDGNPHNEIYLNGKKLKNHGNYRDTNNRALGPKILVIAHEIGHCIGFRHTDWYNRSISCLGDPIKESNEGLPQHILGTPDSTMTQDLEESSWMLACLRSEWELDGENYIFTSQDKAALHSLY